MRNVHEKIIRVRKQACIFLFKVDWSFEANTILKLRMKEQRLQRSPARNLSSKKATSTFGMK